MLFNLPSKNPELQNQISRWIEETRKNHNQEIEYELSPKENASSAKLIIKHKVTKSDNFVGIEIKLVEAFDTEQLITTIQIDELHQHDINLVDQFTKSDKGNIQQVADYGSKNPNFKITSTKARQILEDKILIPFAKQMNLVADKDIEAVFNNTLARVLENEGYPNGSIKDLPDGSSVKTNFTLDKENKTITIHTVQTYPDKLENIFDAEAQYTQVDGHKGHFFKLLSYNHTQTTWIQRDCNPTELVTTTIKEYKESDFVKLQPKQEAVALLVRNSLAHTCDSLGIQCHQQALSR